MIPKGTVSTMGRSMAFARDVVCGGKPVSPYERAATMVQPATRATTPPARSVVPRNSRLKAAASSAVCGFRRTRYGTSTVIIPLDRIALGIFRRFVK